MTNHLFNHKWELDNGQDKIFYVRILTERQKDKRTVYVTSYSGFDEDSSEDFDMFIESIIADMILGKLFFEVLLTVIVYIFVIRKLLLLVLIICILYANILLCLAICFHSKYNLLYHSTIKVSAQNVFPTTPNAVDIQETTTDAVTEPIPGPDEIKTASIDLTSKSAETTSNEIVITDSITEAVSETPADFQSSLKPLVDVQSSSEAPVDAQNSSEAPVDMQSSSEAIISKIGPTPVAPPCPKSLCIAKSNGNFEIVGYPHDFVQCSNGIATCQSCWPQSLFFSQTCNQCLYKQKDSCYTTKAWKPQSTYPCPDACPNKGPNFSGNIADNVSNGGAGNPYQYIGCWKGVTQGCVICPAGLKFNEQSNACLFDGLYQTKPN
ncbi:uncharacterized protein LOC136083135 [Hydra vulgaris]|uniref:Uncharacterized protein LOC136083135 n=1 Tax=Hydra vulgaris TaxID=6087 RepID=A0ABM4CAD7_HYDVU